MMQDYTKGIALAGLTEIKPTPMKQFSGELPELAAMEPTAQQMRLAALGARMPQSTIFEVGGKIIGSIGDDGSSTFYSSGDAGSGGRQYSVAEHASWLREKYGDMLNIKTFPFGEAPASLDVNRLAVGESYAAIDARV